MSPALPRRRRRKDGEQEQAPPQQGGAAQVAESTAEQQEAEAPSAGQSGAQEQQAPEQAADAQGQEQQEAPQADQGEAQPAAAVAEAALSDVDEQTEPERQAPAPAPVFRPGPAPRVGGRVAVSARARYVRTSPRKARLVCEHIRGRSVAEARALLAHTPRAVARDWAKLLESAVANAEHNHELAADDLVVRAAYADAGPTIKRFRPRAMGRATPIMKRTAHLTITLSTER